MSASDPIAEVLDLLCPMHCRVSAEGVITHAGATLARMRPTPPLTGRAFFEVFSMHRPHPFDDVAKLHAQAGRKLHLAFRDAPHTAFKGIAVSLGVDLVVNLSFGISILDGVRDYALTHADFAATDLAIEMLYLMEAKSAAMEASRRLNLRLQGARLAAEEQAFTDTLTGLGNRRMLDRVLARLVTSAQAFAVMQIDLDWFKAVNDTRGHAAGDQVLREVARVLGEETRASDTIARVGGDEFTVLLPGLGDDRLLRRIGERIIERLERPIPFEGQSCRVSASIGTLRVRAGQALCADAVLADADLALYASKRAGRGRQTFFTPALRIAEAQG
jgi:diguanylate cyclase (GGDEF)-like protein